MSNPNTESTPEAAGHRLAHFPINIFAMTMGLGGFAVALHQFETHLGLTRFLSGMALLFTLGVLALLTLIYLFKLLRHPAAVAKEWGHPIKISFFPAVSISILVAAIALLPFSRELSSMFWHVGAPLNLVATLAVVRSWIRLEHYQPVHLNPAWFIPAVGNILVPIVGVHHAPVDVSWFFFSVGLLFWILLLATIFNRLIFHTPLPGKLLPTLFILIAPPAVGFLSYTALNGGRMDPFAHILFHSGLFFFLLLLSKIGQLSKVGFSLAWWAYSFPMAALTLSVYRYGVLQGAPIAELVGHVLFALLTLIIALLLFRTSIAILKKKICVPE